MNSAFITRNGKEQLSESLVKLHPSDLTLALLSVAAHFGIDRTEEAIKETFLRSEANQIVQAMNATLCYIYA